VAVLALCVAAAKGATPAPPSPPAPVYRDVLIKDVPHVKQKPDFCGEACAEMALARLGKRHTQDDVFNVSGVDPVLGRGCRTPELAAALTRIGFKVGDVYRKVAAPRAAAETEAAWAALHAGLVRGMPSIVCMHYNDKPQTTEHFRLVIGYEKKADEVIYQEPGEDGGSERRLKRSEFISLWPLKYEKDTWTVIRLALEPGALADPPPRGEGFSPAEFAQHVMVLKKKAPSSDFAIALAPPFVVVGDEPPEVVRRLAAGTVKWAVDKLKADYFRKDPAEIIDVWLFRDKASYEKHTRSIFNDSPSTPFGYYSALHGALIMNIATGGGTLVHEIVHPFVRANFPECPAWFNEGLGSLYEQSEEKAGHIHGRTNWRLAGLQEAIAKGQTVSFETLTCQPDGQFYRSKGPSYAQARYLCYYLQENGLLVKFYHAYVAAQKEDPTGYKTLQKVLGEKDMAAFQKRWEAYVTKLAFP
jgi:hypothetical protein